MMEEINDDANGGESSFEFVSRKLEENLTIGDPIPVSVENISPVQPKFTAPVASVPAPTNNLFTMATSGNTGLFSPTISTGINMPPSPAPIPMFDPSKHPALPSMQFSTPSFAPPIQLTQPAVSPYIPPGQGYIQTPPTSAYAAGDVAEAALELSLDDNYVNAGNQPYIAEGYERGVWGWIRSSEFLNKVAEKAKNSVDSVITTLDPGMKEIIYSGGDLNIIIASNNETKVSALREAFQQIFGKATVEGIPVQSTSIAPQPVGFSAGMKAVEERISNLRQQNLISEDQVVVAVENFLAEFTPDKWFDLGCLILQDPCNSITLQVYTQATPVPTHFVMQAKDQTPPDFPQGWSGYAVTIGQILGPALGVRHSEWHQALTGIPRRDMLLMAAKSLAGMYKSQRKRL